MNDLFTYQSRIIVTCSNRLSAFLTSEIKDAGLMPLRVFKTGVELQGNLIDCIRLNLRLRCGGQVLFSLKSFTANSPDDVYREVKSIAWEEIIPADGYFSVSGNVNTPSISNGLFANVKVKDAVADRFREKTGARPDSGPGLHQSVVHLFWRDDEAEIFIDTSGETLAKHGYRKIPGKAPMMESLAAATISASSWDRKSNFINPMCGSGTLAIEAACIATNRFPGLFRNNYAFMHLTGFREEFYRTALSEIEAEITAPGNIKIIATDISEDAVEISRVNAGIAGVEELIEFAVCDFADTVIPAASGFPAIFFNPEYGDRLGEEPFLEKEYKRMGDFLKQSCKGYWGYIFTGNPDLAKKIGLKPKRRVEFYNGKIDCRLLEYELYAGSRQLLPSAP